MSRNCLVIDLDYCLDCKGCEVACKMENKLSLTQRWNRVYTCGPFGSYPELSLYYLPMQCQQCENAPCIEVCPVGASYRDPDDGVVLVNQDECIGCKSCLSACPYHVRAWDEESQTVSKCTLCHHLTTEGEKPFCVTTCSAGCRFYGDLDDPDSDASKAIAAKPDAVHYMYDTGNKPVAVYLLSPQFGEWHEDEERDLHDTSLVDWDGK